MAVLVAVSKDSHAVFPSIIRGRTSASPAAGGFKLRLLASPLGQRAPGSLGAQTKKAHCSGTSSEAALSRGGQAGRRQPRRRRQGTETAPQKCAAKMLRQVPCQPGPEWMRSVPHPLAPTSEEAPRPPEHLFAKPHPPRSLTCLHFSRALPYF